MKKKILFINRGAWRKCLSVLCILCCSSLIVFGQKAIKGHVIDATGEAVVGANVVEKGTSNGTTTDADGNFSLTVSGSAVLQISYIGYATQEIPVGNSNSISVTLSEDLQALDEVVVVGYGTQRKSSMTAAVTNVNTKELQNIPRPSIYSALQGRVAGLTVNETTGEPDKTASLLVRGVGTIDGSTGPLILIDGTPGSVAHISPYDVESISVLKDAAAAAIYGARAANGVILVTTKQGALTDGKPKLQFDSYVGFQTFAQFPKALTAYEYATLVDEIHLNDGGQAVFSQKDLEMYKNGVTDDLHGNTNWYDLCVMDVAPIYTNHISLSGSGKIGKYFVSAEYVDQKGMVKDIDNYERLNVRANVTSDVTKNFQVQFLSSYTRNHRDVDGSLSGILDATITTAAIGAYKYSDGHYAGMIFAKDAYLWDTGNPRRSIDEYGPKDYYWNTMSTAVNLIYKPIEGLELKGMGVYRYSGSDNQSYNRYGDQWDPINQYYAQTVPATLYDTWTKEYKYDMQLTAAYEKYLLDDHYFKIFGGYSQESLRSDYISGYRKGFINDAIYELDAGDASTQTNNGSADQWAFASLFGRLNYNYQNKYLFEANMRYDGSSRFAPGKQWGLFPSVSVGWNLSREGFMEDYKSIDNLKLRLSWGQLGNAEKVGLYQWFAGISSGSYYNFNDNLVFGTRPGSFANTDLTWETTTTYNLGLDGSFWNGKLSFELDLWEKRTDDILLSAPISTVIGAPSSRLTINAGLVGSRGFDLQIGHNGKITNDLSYNLRLVLQSWNSWIIDLKDRATPFSTEFRPGEELGNYYGYECLGIINDTETLNQYKKIQNVAPQTDLGDLMYKDQNGDGKLDYLDNVKIGNYYTKGSYGLNIGLNYRGFDFQAFFQGAFNVDKSVSGNARRAWVNFHPGDANLLDRWTVDNPDPDAKNPRQRKSYDFNYSNSSFWIRDASYMKLKNLQIGYNLPVALISKIGLDNCRFYVSGTNLFTIKSSEFLDGYDPEVEMTPGLYPTLRVYSIGFNVQF